MEIFATNGYDSSESMLPTNDPLLQQYAKVKLHCLYCVNQPSCFAGFFPVFYSTNITNSKPVPPQTRKSYPLNFVDKTLIVTLPTRNPKSRSTWQYEGGSTHYHFHNTPRFRHRCTFPMLSRFLWICTRHRILFPLFVFVKWGRDCCTSWDCLKKS